MDFYNLDAIISVGYGVNSIRATQFRQWATGVLREFAIKGYVLDRRRMENGSFLGEDYFERLLAEIREIRLSERRFYQKITDIYATSVDYNKDAPTTKAFFAKVQNKLLYAIHGHTAAELIRKRVDSSKPHMGLTSWENAPEGKILKTDVTVAKNYLTKDRIVNAYLELAEDRARRKMPMSMEDCPSGWTPSLNLMNGKCYRTAARFLQNLPRRMRKVNSRATELCRIACATEEELIAHARERVAHFKVPKSVHFVDDLPRSTAGKLLKRELRKQFGTV